ncbi:MAG: hypothetical protein KAY65_05300, partial [Planctomycetes bacterium]|nr:hypothetical protein [Planctomycetota bacterium]
MTTKKRLARLFLLAIALCVGLRAAEANKPVASGTAGEHLKSIREFGVLPTNNAALNRDNLQKAIDWANPRGAALYVEPSQEPYPAAGGIILRANV